MGPSGARIVAIEVAAERLASLGPCVPLLGIEWAADQLAAGSGSISEIALAAGFADQSHFTREFKRHAGLPPGRYRRARRG